jgi:hypothetical protein
MRLGRNREVEEGGEESDGEATVKAGLDFDHVAAGSQRTERMSWDDGATFLGRRSY